MSLLNTQQEMGLIILKSMVKINRKIRY